MISVRHNERPLRFACLALALAAGCGGTPFSASSESSAAGMAGAAPSGIAGATPSGTAGASSGAGGGAGANPTTPDGGAGGQVSGSAGSATTGGTGGLGGTAGDTTVGINTLMARCAALGADAGYDTSNQHCYLLVRQLLSFGAAREHCTALGAHLATVANAAENGYVWSRGETDHWLGASDGKAVTAPGAGKYTWLSGEPFMFQAWTSGQPNAANFMCAEGSCYEHCLVQWGGGKAPGEWNDNGCTEALSSICEWDE